MGTPVAIQIPALQQKREGRIARLTQLVTSNSRSMEAEVDVKNADGSIAPGMIAEIRLQGTGPKEVSSLPVQAVVRRGGQSYVLAVRDDHTLEERRVETGIENASSVELLSGLIAGESVVLGNLSLLRPGQRVEIKAGGAN